MNETERASLEAEYRRRKVEIRETPGLSWEQKERKIKAMGDELREKLRGRKETEAA
jgi:hypothetical protein